MVLEIETGGPVVEGRAVGPVVHRDAAAADVDRRQVCRLVHATRDTIVAISTPPGRSGIGMVRLSGARRVLSLRRFCVFAEPEWEPWTAALAELIDPEGDVVDQVVATFFAAPRSYTAEDWSKSPATDRPWFFAIRLERAVRLAHGWPSRASSRCAHT